MNQLGSILGSLEQRDDRCETHGAFTSLRIHGRWSGCPKCAEHAAKNERERDERQAQADHENRMRALRWNAAGVPARMGNVDFSTYSTDGHAQMVKNLEACREFIDSFDPSHGNGVIMIGTIGTGKTHLSIAMLRAAIFDKGVTGRYVTEKSMSMRLKDSYRTRKESELDIVRSYTDPDLLVIDEVGVSGNSEHDAMLLHTVMAERYDACKATVLVSNLTAEGLRSWLGDRVTDRTRQTSRILVFNWESYRGKA